MAGGGNGVGNAMWPGVWGLEKRMEVLEEDGLLAGWMAWDAERAGKERSVSMTQCKAAVLQRKVELDCAPD